MLSTRTAKEVILSKKRIGEWWDGRSVFSFLFPLMTPALFVASSSSAQASGAADWGFPSSMVAGFQVMLVILSFTLALLYARKAANQAHKRALMAEAEADLVRAETEVVQAKAELAQHNSEQAQEFAETLIESATVIIIGVDGEGQLSLFNKTAEKITGYTSQELAEGNWLEMLFPGEDFSPARDALTAMIRKELDKPVESLLIARSGDERQIAWQCRHVLWQDEEIALMFGVDLTERSLAERERHDLERKLLDMQKLESLGVLAGGIAHDFNNLLTAILGNAQLAKLQMLRSSPVHQYLMEIERTSLQAADLCKQMLAYSGQGKVETRLLDLNRMIRDMSQLLRISVAKKVQLSFDLAHTLPLIQGDASQIRQVLVNLIINASEAIVDKEGSIWVSTGVVHGAKHLFEGMTVTGRPQERDYVFVSIADTGCGMDEETRARIFDPFFTTKFTGRGLGLAAVLGIVRSHDGTLELTSNEGEGTTFTLLFPRAESRGQVALRDDEPAATPCWSGEGLVLVVDDEESVRTLMSRMLESFQFHVMEAVDGRDAVEKFSAHADAITAVLLDVTMPVMSGLEAYDQIRRLKPDVPVLFMSGYMSEGELKNMTGATDFIQKPFKLDEFQSKLRLLLSGSSMESK
jgi:two-component system cell cycle sensor histidine kinase/response regulator CckA